MPGVMTRKQRKAEEKIPSVKQHVIDIDADDEEEEATVPEPSSKTPQNNVTTTSKYFPTDYEDTLFQSKAIQKLDLNQEEEKMALRYDLPEELKDDHPSSSAKRSKTTTLSSDDDSDTEEEAPLTSFKKQRTTEKTNGSTTTPECISIPSCSVGETPSSGLAGLMDNDAEGNTVMEDLTSPIPATNPIDTKLDNFSKNFKTVTDNYNQLVGQLFDEIMFELNADWTLNPENKLRFKKGIELAAKIAQSTSQKARVFYLTLSYYILYEKNSLEYYRNDLFDPLSHFDVEVTQTDRVNIDLSSITFDMVLTEYASNQKILSVLKKHHTLFFLSKLEKKAKDNKLNISNRIDCLRTIINHQHNDIRKVLTSNKR